jgi:hypothetical protein
LQGEIERRGTVVRPITKSDFLAGIQCPLRLWNRHHAPIPFEDREETSVMRAGTNVGSLARQLFLGGVLVEAEPWAREEAVAATQALIADPRVPAIFEAGFLCDGLHARVDVLARKPLGAFALYEVKSTGEVKDHHIPDLAFQVRVARACGLTISEAGIVHINKEYERGQELDARGLFTVSDQTARIADYIAAADEAIARQRAILSASVPAVEPGGHCHDPYECEFWERCTAGKPEDWIFYLPRSGKRYEQLRSRGIESIRAIPDDFELTPLQARIREVLRSGKPYVGPNLASALRAIEPPVNYLDFETVNPAVPIWPGTYPFQRIPFQWSLHRRSDAGSLSHAEFLAVGDVDPRRLLSESLAEQLAASDETIVVYNKGFEGAVLRDLADQFDDLALHLRAIESRLWDLLPVVRNHVYLPEFDGSFSIKAVAPALAPEISYSELEGVAEGMAASDAFIRIVTGELSDGETEDMIRKSLLTYCRLDTFAMMAVVGALQKASR